MAETSGHLVLDELIEEFKGRLLRAEQVRGWTDEFDELMQLGGVPVSALADGKISYGTCADVSRVFKEFVEEKKRAFDRENDGWLAYPIGLVITGQRTPGYYGYHDRVVEGCISHCCTIVHTDEGTFAVDFTASQYGYDEFPLVQARDEMEWDLDLNPEPSWLRVWDRASLRAYVAYADEARQSEPVAA